MTPRPSSSNDATLLTQVFYVSVQAELADLQSNSTWLVVPLVEQKATFLPCVSRGSALAITRVDAVHHAFF